MSNSRNYKTVWCVKCQDHHRPSQPTRHVVFHTDPFGTRYIPEIPNRYCLHCCRIISYDRNYGGWYHHGYRHGYKQCESPPIQYTYATPR